MDGEDRSAISQPITSDIEVKEASKPLINKTTALTFLESQGVIATIDELKKKLTMGGAETACEEQLHTMLETLKKTTFDDGNGLAALSAHPQLLERIINIGTIRMLEMIDDAQILSNASPSDDLEKIQQKLMGRLEGAAKKKAKVLEDLKDNANQGDFITLFSHPITRKKVELFLSLLPDSDPQKATFKSYADKLIQFANEANTFGNKDDPVAHAELISKLALKYNIAEVAGNIKPLFTALKNQYAPDLDLIMANLYVTGEKEGLKHSNFESDLIQITQLFPKYELFMGRLVAATRNTDPALTDLIQLNTTFSNISTEIDRTVKSIAAQAPVQTSKAKSLTALIDEAKQHDRGLLDNNIPPKQYRTDNTTAIQDIAAVLVAKSRQITAQAINLPDMQAIDVTDPKIASKQITQLADNATKIASEYSSNVTTLVMQDITNAQDINQATYCAERWINIASQCLAQGDFQSVIAIMAGFDATLVHRLNLPARLSPETNFMFKQLMTILQYSKEPKYAAEFAELRKKWGNETTAFMGHYKGILALLKNPQDPNYQIILNDLKFLQANQQYNTNLASAFKTTFSQDNNSRKEIRTLCSTTSKSIYPDTQKTKDAKKKSSKLRIVENASDLIEKEILKNNETLTNYMLRHDEIEANKKLKKLDAFLGAMTPDELTRRIDLLRQDGKLTLKFKKSDLAQEFDETLKSLSKLPLDKKLEYANKLGNIFEDLFTQYPDAKKYYSPAVYPDIKLIHDAITNAKQTRKMAARENLISEMNNHSNGDFINTYANPNSLGNRLLNDFMAKLPANKEKTLLGLYIQELRAFATQVKDFHEQDPIARTQFIAELAQKMDIALIISLMPELMEKVQNANIETMKNYSMLIDGETHSLNKVSERAMLGTQWLYKYPLFLTQLSEGQAEHGPEHQKYKSLLDAFESLANRGNEYLNKFPNQTLEEAGKLNDYIIQIEIDRRTLPLHERLHFEQNLPIRLEKDRLEAQKENCYSYIGYITNNVDDPNLKMLCESIVGKIINKQASLPPFDEAKFATALNEIVQRFSSNEPIPKSEFTTHYQSFLNAFQAYPGFSNVEQDFYRALAAHNAKTLTVTPVDITVHQKSLNDLTTQIADGLIDPATQSPNHQRIQDAYEKLNALENNVTDQLNKAKNLKASLPDNASQIQTIDANITQLTELKKDIDSLRRQTSNTVNARLMHTTSTPTTVKPVEKPRMSTFEKLKSLVTSKKEHAPTLPSSRSLRH